MISTEYSGSYFIILINNGTVVDKKVIPMLVNGIYAFSSSNAETEQRYIIVIQSNLDIQLYNFSFSIHLSDYDTNTCVIRHINISNTKENLIMNNKNTKIWTKNEDMEQIEVYPKGVIEYLKFMFDNNKQALDKYNLYIPIGDKCTCENTMYDYAGPFIVPDSMNVFVDEYMTMYIKFSICDGCNTYLIKELMISED